MSMKFTLFGAKSTGKTTYIGALRSDFIYMPEEKTRIYSENNSIKKSDEGLIYPQSTPSGHMEELTYIFKNENTEIEFELRDYDGNFAEKLTLQEEKGKKFIQYMKDSKGIIFFFPYYTEEEVEDAKDKISVIYDQLDFLLMKVLGGKKTRKVKPVVIAVTMWDKHDDYKNNSQKNAEKYLKNFYTKHYKRIKDNFETLEIIPISSVKNFNIDEPIQFLTQGVYKVWENHIEKQYSSANTLNEQKELYEYIKNRKEYLEEYKDNKYIAIMNKLKKELDKDFKKKFVIGLIIVFLFGLVSYFVISNNEKIDEKQLYEKIVSKDKQQDYAGLYENIDNYLKNYKNIDQNHYKKIVNIQSTFVVRCEKSVKEKLKKIYNIKSLERYYDELKFLEADAQSCKILRLQEEINAKKLNTELLYQQYIDSQKILDNFSIESMDENEMIQVVQTIGKLENYNEKQIILDKFLVIVDRIGTSDNENTISMILDRTSSLKIPDILISKLKENLKNLREEQLYAEVIKDIQNSDFKHAIVHVESILKGELTKLQEDHIKILLDKKFNTTVENLLKNTPNSVRNVDDYYRLKKTFEDFELLEANGKLKNILYKPSIGNTNKNILDKTLKLLRKTEGILNYGVRPKHITFLAYNKNNSLNFSCDGMIKEDELRITIGTYKYSEDGAICNGTKITYLNKYRYKSGNYYGYALESDMIFDEKYNFRFKLSDNDIILMSNGKQIKKNIGHNYRILFEQ